MSTSSIGLWNRGSSAGVSNGKSYKITMSYNFDNNSMCNCKVECLLEDNNEYTMRQFYHHLQTQQLYWQFLPDLLHRILAALLFDGYLNPVLEDSICSAKPVTRRPKLKKRLDKLCDTFDSCLNYSKVASPTILAAQNRSKSRDNKVGLKFGRLIVILNELSIFILFHATKLNRLDLKK